MAIILAFADITFAQVNLDSMLVAYYPFNGNAIDESGNGNNGAVNGAVLTEDRFGNENSAFWFDGISSFIEVPDNESLDIVSEISISGWLKKDSNVPWASMVTKGGESMEDNNYTIHNSVDGGIIFTGFSDTSCMSSVGIAINEWHFVTFTWDGYIGKIYIDSEVDSLSFISYDGELYPNNFSLFIGVDHPGATEFFHGYLDDIRIYKRCLNEEEIVLLFNEGLTNVKKQKIQAAYQIKISPNPFNIKTTIKFPNPTHSNYKLSVFNISGNKVFEMDNIKTNKIEFEKGNLPEGVYLIELKGEKVFRGKMVVK